MKSISFSLVILFLLTSAGLAQPDQQIAAAQAEPHRWGYLTVSLNPRWTPVAAAEVARLEYEMGQHQDDATVRIKLMNYYWHHQMRLQRSWSVFWLIEHHPESPILGLDIAWLFPNLKMAGEHYGPMHDDSDFDRARQLWRSVISQDLTVPEALHNAARFFEATDASLSDDLARRLQQSDPEGHGKQVAYYFTTVAPGLQPQRAAEHRY